MRVLASATLLAVLLACSPSPSAKKDAAPPAAAGGSSTQLAAKITPGMWRSSMTFDEISRPGMPKAALKVRPIVTEECISSDDINAYLNRKTTTEDEESKCLSNSFRAAGGVIQGTSSCAGPDGATRQVSVSGTYTPEQVDMTMKMSRDTPRGPMSSTMHITSQRTGACKG